MTRAELLKALERGEIRIVSYIPATRTSDVTKALKEALK